MRLVREILEQRRQRAGATLEQLPAGYCEECLERHACWTCHDAQRIRRRRAYVEHERGEALADGQFGKAVPCPDCLGSGGTAAQEWGQRTDIPAFLAGARIEGFDPPEHPGRVAAEWYVEAWPPEPPMLLLAGRPGNGKTHLAVGILHAALVMHKVRGLYVRTVDVLSDLRAAFDSEYAAYDQEGIRTKLTRRPLLVLDDLGAESGTNWAWEQLYSMIDRRYADRLPTVVTTNASVLDLPARVASRVRSGVEVIFEDSDYRRRAR